MSSFMAGIGARTAVQSIGMVEDKKKQGWDNFLAGAGRVGGSFLKGFATGLSSYNPNNPYSSFGAAIMGATAGLQQNLEQPLKRQEAALATELETQRTAARQAQEERGMMSMSQTLEDIYRSQADRASVMPDIAGIMSGVAKQKPQEEPFGIQVGYGSTAAARTLGLVK